MHTPDRLDPESLFARREGEFRPSPVRAVFELAMRPEFVSLAGGNPDTELLPHDLIADLTAQLLRERGAEILQYGSGAGISTLPQSISMLMAAADATVSADNLLITTGSQMGLDLVTKLFCDRGDVVIAEGPTYVGAMGVFGSYEVDLRQVAIAEVAHLKQVAATREVAKATATEPRSLFSRSASDRAPSIGTNIST